MPELAEVERARSLLENVALGKFIKEVRSTEDDRVFANNSRQVLETCLLGRKVTAVKRLGKYFYMQLDGSGPVPVIHFGMSGACAIKGGEPMYYRKKPKDDHEWPPRYWKLCLVFDDLSEYATMDARRFGKIQAIEGDPLLLPPLSLLGRDPLHDMPTVEEVQTALASRSAPIKAVLLDQSILFAGLGNWLVDEILYQALLHPSQPSHTLTLDHIKTLHYQIHHIVKTAVECNADHNKFPEDWLFSRRWSKGKKDAPTSFKRADGSVVKINFETVGGRTSAVCDVQKRFHSDAVVGPRKRKVKTVLLEETQEEVAEQDEDLVPLLKEDEEPIITTKSRKKTKSQAASQGGTDNHDNISTLRRSTRPK